MEILSKSVNITDFSTNKIYYQGQEGKWDVGEFGEMIEVRLCKEGHITLTQKTCKRGYNDYS